MGILKRVKYEIFFIGILAIMLGGCGTEHTRILTLELHDVKYNSKKSMPSCDARTIIEFLRKYKPYAGRYEVKVTLWFKGIDVDEDYSGTFAYFATFNGEEGEFFEHTQRNIPMEILIPSRYRVYAAVVMLNLKSHRQIALQSPDTIIYVSGGGGGGGERGYSINAITCDSCITISTNEQTDIPYSLPILFRTKYNGQAQNGISVKFHLSNPSAGSIIEDPTSHSFLNQSGIVKPVFQPSLNFIGDVNLIASIQSDSDTATDSVTIHVIQDEETTQLSECNAHSCTHRRASYPDGPEIKGDGIEDYNGTKDVWVEIDTVAGWRGNYTDANLDIILSVAKFTLEHAVCANTDWSQGQGSTDYYDTVPSGITVHFKPIGFIDETQYDTLSSKSNLAKVLSLYRNPNYKDAIHVIITYLGTGELARDFGAAVNYSIFKGDSADIENHLSSRDSLWSILYKSLGPEREQYMDSTGCVVFYGKGNDTVLPPVRDSLVGITLAHEIGHALGMTHVCDVTLATDNKAENWYFTMFEFLYGNVMYPTVYYSPTNLVEETLVAETHFLLQSLEDSNDWREAEDTTNFNDTHFKHIKGHPGLCTRDILGIDNATHALKGYLMDAPPWINQKKQGGTK